MIKVMLVDDQAAVRQGLRMCLGREPDMAVVGEADDARCALAIVASVDPDVVLMDMRLPGLDGILATRALLSAAPRSAVIILTMYGDTRTRDRAAGAGAAAYVGKHERVAVLLAAIRAAVRQSYRG